MTLIMGIDTGGTFTDGVILDPAAKKILCKSKAFTMKHDLASTIGECISNLTPDQAAKISFVCLSTTLATNSVLEGKRGRVALLLTGGRPEGQLPADLCIELKGKLDIKGRETEPIDDDEVSRAVESMRDQVDAVAISGYASVRNPSHEMKIKQLVRDQLSLPVVCGHELSSQLGYYDRTCTAALNAGLIPIIGEMIRAIKTTLISKGINVPIMIVKGDGSLMQESLAVSRPIETILSGPAASMTGAVYLTNKKDALVLDMGGTTTDTAVVAGGSVKINNSGAMVGGWYPQIRAADLRTYGIGGDSRVSISPEGTAVIGPRRVMPLCAAGNRYPNLVRELEAISRYDGADIPETGADCLILVKRPGKITLSKLEKRIVSILQEDAHSHLLIAETLGKKPDELDTVRLENLDIIQRAAFTPTDLLHVRGSYRLWDAEISKLGAEILAKLTNKAVPELLDTVASEITERLFNICRESIGESMTFFHEKPLIAIGAPVKAWVPAVSKRLSASLIIPEHAEVANAIGAAAGKIIETVQVLIRPKKESGEYIMHASWECRQFKTLAEALDYSLPAAERHAAEAAECAGGTNVEVSVSKDDIYIDDYIKSAKNYIETRISATASGYPQ